MKPSFSSIAGVRGRKVIHGGFMYTEQRTVMNFLEYRY